MAQSTGNGGASSTGAGGNAGNYTVTTRNGWNATAGIANGGNSGSIIFTVGTPGTSFGGSAGTIGSIQLAGPLTVAPGSSAQAIASSGTVTLPTASPCAVLNPAGAVTGVILPVGRFDGDTIILINKSAFSVTMAASGTSHVADGTSAVISTLTQKTFVWSSTASLWYHN